MKGWSVVEMKEWSLDPPLPSSHLRAGSGGVGLLLKVLAKVWSSEGKYHFFLLLLLLPVLMAIDFEQILTCSILGPCCSAVIAMPSISIHEDEVFQYVSLYFFFQPLLFFSLATEPSAGVTTPGLLEMALQSMRSVLAEG